MIVKQKICFYHTLQLHFNVIGLMENDAKKDDCYKIKESAKFYKKGEKKKEEKQIIDTRNTI